ncbi:probably inactive leucine-rich repeat receptor-like protein kinase At5g48380 [Humulus lupulus]|uniref:probably inactive leucine-rich repeat receptor-like protein kinase At5g48380 n=1 Tax=Humulus lupulus TaxID=3486 RepID=UPI002B410884|nr:probably inactive leucine-rich repeat receptor-like protein kinase At5g48380 [Humulus lupulus]
MLLSSRALDGFAFILLWLMLRSSSCHGDQNDINCLKSIKEDSLEDPFGYLNSWNFNNYAEGFICQFTGVECWHPDESKVQNIRLSDMGLKGPFPRGIENCKSLTGLDLSNNKLYGPIPTDISKLIGFVTTLDLSSNNFSGPIPQQLSNCTYLNVLKLDHNRLTGQIPLELGQLSRLKEFSATNNLLTGPVPIFQSKLITAQSYANNPGLCGVVLEPCEASPKKSRTVIIVASAVGGVTFAALVVLLVLQDS